MVLPLAKTLKEKLPQVKTAVVTTHQQTHILNYGDVKLKKQGHTVSDHFFDMFSWKFIKGNAASPLPDAYSIVLTQSAATALFGNSDPINKIIRVDNDYDAKVTAIVADVPGNSSFQFDFINTFNYSNDYLKQAMNNWQNSSWDVYIQPNPGTNMSLLEKNITELKYQHDPDDKKISSYFAFPMNKWRLYSDFKNGKNTGGMIEYVKLFAIIAALILIIACINFMNLSTARSEKRAKEVGIRKVVGAQKQFLIIQFIIESILLAFTAGILAVIIVQLVLPAYNQLLGLKLFLDFSSPYYWLFAIAFIVFTGLLAGAYPAFYLSSFRPVKVLKGGFTSADKVVTPRRILVVLQFTFAIAFIICTIIVQNQINYAQRRDAGYSRNNLAFIIEFGDAHKNYELIKHDLLASGAATAVAQTSCPITEAWGDSWGFTWKGSTEDDKKTDFIMFGADEDFTKTMGTKVIQGRGIDINIYKTDSTACLLNETAVKVMRLKDPVGQVIRAGRDSVHVVGVVKDFILTTPYEPIQQMIIGGPVFGQMVVNFKLNPNPSIASSLQKVETVFKKYNPQYPFNVRFYDQEYDKKFQDEKQTGTLAGLFAALTIFISCLGLLGLATYVAQSRIKEIGVRKVLGASVRGIVALLSKDFLRLVLISFLIASPVAWFMMNHWLASYSYRVNISWWVFAAAGLMSVAIAFITVSFHAIKAAIANPVKSLRTE
jgi:ABC-type antimicrobial peptide transport system permease subunit